MHVDGFVRGKGMFMITEYVPTEERTHDRFPLLLTTGRILSQYNVGAQTRRTAQRRVASTRTCWRSTPRRREPRHRGRRLGRASPAARARPRCTRRVSERMQPGVVYTTFHFPEYRRQRRHDRVLRLGHQLPRVQGHGGAGLEGQPQRLRVAGSLRRDAQANDPDAEPPGVDSSPRWRRDREKV